MCTSNVGIQADASCLPVSSPSPPPRYARLPDVEILKRLLVVCEKETVAYNEEGLEAIIFTADGDMRQSLNNLQVRGLWAEVFWGGGAELCIRAE